MSNVKNALDSFAFDVVDDAKRELQRKKKNASKTLSDSLDYDLNVSKNSFSLSFFMEDYGEFIDAGVKGAGGTKADGVNGKENVQVIYLYLKRAKDLLIRCHLVEHLTNGLYVKEYHHVKTVSSQLEKG